MIERPKSSEPPVAPENTGRANFDLQTGRDLRKILRKQTRYSLDQNLSNNRVNIFRASIVLLRSSTSRFFSTNLILLLYTFILAIPLLESAGSTLVENMPGARL